MPGGGCGERGRQDSGVVELEWLKGKFSLSIEMIREIVVDRYDLQEGFCENDCGLFPDMSTKVLIDYDIIDIGDRKIEVLHIFDHLPELLSFLEENKGYLFTGDLVYKDILLAYSLSTTLGAYFDSLTQFAVLSVEKIFLVHH